MPSSFQKVLSQIQATRAHVATMQLGANGWKAGELNGAQLCEPQTNLYFWDRPTSWVFLCSIPYSSFKTVSMQASRFSDPEVAAVRFGVSSAINALAIGSTLPTLNGLTTQEQLALSAAAYMGTTKVWLAADRMQNQASALILNYREHANANEGMLRPVVAPTSQIFPADALLTAIDHITQQDKIKHPEWFTPNSKD